MAIMGYNYSGARTFAVTVVQFVLVLTNRRPIGLHINAIRFLPMGLKPLVALTLYLGVLTGRWTRRRAGKTEYNGVEIPRPFVETGKVTVARH